MSGNGDASSGLGDKIFGGGFGDEDDEDASADDASDDGTASEDEDAAAAATAALAELKLDDGAPRPWLSPSPYAPLYVKSVGEYLPASAPESDAKDIPDGDLPGGKEDKELKWAMEAYEQSLKLDGLFERFVKRVALEPQQGVRCVCPPLE